MPARSTKKKVRTVRANRVTQPVMTSMGQLSMALVLFVVVNTVVILLANMLFPQSVVLGNDLISPVMAAIYSMVVLSLMAVGMMPVIEFVTVQQKMNLTSTHWMLLYWVINTGGLWLLSRFAELLGMGLRSWVVAVVLGLVLNLVQGMVMMKVVSKVS